MLSLQHPQHSHHRYEELRIVIFCNLHKDWQFSTFHSVWCTYMYLCLPQCAKIWMELICRSSCRAPPAGVTAPWFARPLLPPPRPSPEATASTVSAGGGDPGEDIEASFYEDDHVMVPAAAAAAAMAATSFRNR